MSDKSDKPVGIPIKIIWTPRPPGPRVVVVPPPTMSEGSIVVPAFVEVSPDWFVPNPVTQQARRETEPDTPDGER